MKRPVFILVLLFAISLTTFAKKDFEAWKSEKNLDMQFEVFKNNLKYWNGSYFLSEQQLNEFLKAVTDSIAGLEKNLAESKNQIKILHDELEQNKREIEEIQAKLDNSIKRENSMVVLGLKVNKTVYNAGIFLFILGIFVLTGVVFFLFKRSNLVTQRTKKDYNELKEEYEVHKKSAMERYVKLNTELTRTRLELNRRHNLTIE